MSDEDFPFRPFHDKPAHLEGYALTGGYDGEGVVSRAELERAVAARPTVPLRVGDRIVGEAHLSVDDTGLRVSADIEPVDEGLGPQLPTTAPELIRRGAPAQFVAALRRAVSMSVQDVSIAAVPLEER